MVASLLRPALQDPDDGTITVKVAGTGFDDLKNAIVHWQKPTPAGLIQQSTEIVELYGDLRGRVLYHVTSVFDFVNGTLVNTGDRSTQEQSRVQLPS